MRRAIHVSFLGVVVIALTLFSTQLALGGAGDDSSWEIGTWAIGDFSDNPNLEDLNTATEMANGFLWGMYGSAFTAVDSRENDSCKERHLRDPRFYVGGNHGNDSYSFDASDFGLFVDHGNYNALHFNTQVDAWSLVGERVRWGNYDLE